MIRAVSFRQSAQHGFTLLEVLVAVALVVVVSTLAFTGLNALVRARADTDAFSRQWQQGNRAWQMMRRDIAFAIPGAGRDVRGATQAGFVGQVDGFQLLRYASRDWPQALDAPIHQVRWFVRDGALWRAEYRLPTARRLDEAPMPVMAVAAGTGFEYQDGNGRWHRQWPPVRTLTAGANRALPMAVRWHLASEGQHQQLDFFPLAELSSVAH